MISCPYRDLFGREPQMTDERVDQVARALVAYTLQAREGDQALVSAGGYDAR
jgi:hypothetical protein